MKSTADRGEELTVHDLEREIEREEAEHEKVWEQN
jgi:hypothetical protein